MRTRDDKTMAALIPRRLYIIRSRNLLAGVWSPELRGFMGVRTKFDHRFLAVENHTETGPPFGTAWELEDTGIDLPPEIGMHQSEPTACEHCHQPVRWSGPPAPAPWVHEEPAYDVGCTASPQSRQNEPLYQWLEAQEAALGDERLENPKRNV